jgi:hypothetical protein
MSDPAFLISIKIGRRVFNITEADKFLDNGACVSIITRRIWSGTWHTSTPLMTKKAMREIKAFRRVEHPHKYGSGCTVFSLQR